MRLSCDRQAAMKWAFNKLTNFVRALDRVLPALLLLTLLSWQNTVHAGAASWVFSPELVAADGRLLSPVDFCNRGMEKTAEGHCSDCQLNEDSLIPALALVTAGVGYRAASAKLASGRDVIATPETAGLKGRAPPRA